MKLKFFISTIFIILINNVFSQNISNNDKYYQIGLIWGILKYQDPELSKGKKNCDFELLKFLEETKKITSQSDLNLYFLNYLSKQNEKNIQNKVKNEANFFKNKNYSWIDKKKLGEELYQKLISISNNISGNYYVKTNSLNKMLDFENEKKIIQFDYKNPNHRLLLLFKYWNVINYWNVNKYLIDEDWLDILNNAIPECLNIKSKLEFELFKSKLIAKLQDSHSYYCSPIVNDTLFRYKPFFSVKNVNDSLVVNAVFNKRLASINNIDLGDVITTIEGKSIHYQLENKLKPLISTSNSNFLKKWSTFLFYSPVDSIKVRVTKKDLSTHEKYIKLYKNLKEEDPISFKSDYPDKRFFINKNIYYLSLLDVNSKELKNIFEEIKNTKALILDLRNYPKNLKPGDMAHYLYKEKKVFIKILFPIEKMPSVGEYDGKAPLNLINNPFELGATNDKYYRGKVILLVNKNTQSWAEYLGMEIQASENCLTLGEQTAGSVMNIVSFDMGDGTIVNFSGLGAYYPDNTPAQKKGLKIDQIISESAMGYSPDTYLNKTLKIINTLYGI